MRKTINNPCLTNPCDFGKGIGYSWVCPQQFLNSFCGLLSTAVNFRGREYYPITPIFAPMDQQNKKQMFHTMSSSIYSKQLWCTSTTQNCSLIDYFLLDFCFQTEVFFFNKNNLEVHKMIFLMHKIVLSFLFILLSILHCILLEHLFCLFSLRDVTILKAPEEIFILSVSEDTTISQLPG